MTAVTIWRIGCRENRRPLKPLRRSSASYGCIALVMAGRVGSVPQRWESSRALGDKTAAVSLAIAATTGGL